MSDVHDIRLTEERLRNHLSGNSALQELMCLALMPLLGPYSQERPRRPKGGPDGGRDIEAIYNGSIAVWGAVGFKNGGGNDSQSRRYALEKFKTDIDRVLLENPDLKGFIFFTNVDLTTDQKDALKRGAIARGLRIVDVIDFETLRHILDSPEGLIARLQYLGIPMTPTEQAVLVNKFGSQIQNAVTARFDRVENTLNRMEQFLDLQKPIHRIDIYACLSPPEPSTTIGSGAVFVSISGLLDTKPLNFIIANCPQIPKSATHLLMKPFIWRPSQVDRELITMPPTETANLSLFRVFTEVELTQAGSRLCLADVSVINVSFCCTQNFATRLTGLVVDINGFEVFHAKSNTLVACPCPTLHPKLPVELANQDWHGLVEPLDRNLIFEPPVRSKRFSPLVPA